MRGVCLECGQIGENPPIHPVSILLMATSWPLLMTSIPLIPNSLGWATLGGGTGAGFLAPAFAICWEASNTEEELSEGAVAMLMRVTQSVRSSSDSAPRRKVFLRTFAENQKSPASPLPICKLEICLVMISPRGFWLYITCY